MGSKLKSVKYAKEDGKLTAYEKYEDGSTKIVRINNGIVDYILNGAEKGNKTK